MNRATSVVLVSPDEAARRRFLEPLATAGVAVAMATVEAIVADLQRETADDATPRLVLLHAAPFDDAVLQRVQQLHEARAGRPVRLLVITPDHGDSSIDRLFSHGADDVLHDPHRPVELIARVRGQLGVLEYGADLTERERDAQAIVELTQALASTLAIRDILFTVVRRVAEVARVDRCSIVLVGESDDVGFVVATSDDEGVRDLPLDLRKYPEIREVLATGQPLIVRDASEHPLLAMVRAEGDGTLGFLSLALVPIQHETRPMGAIFLRCRNAESFDERELGLVRTVANATAIALRNARILQSARDATLESTFARAEAERRVQMFQRYADFFESSADGLIVVDREGDLVFSNPRAREILGYTEAELMQRSLQGLVHDKDAARVTQLLEGFAHGVYPRLADLTVRCPGATTLVLGVSFSSVLSDRDAVLMSFRDVTRERQTAVELKQTKEFLERVIESSVDGIISADLDGRVLLFNRAAGRIFGYDPRDVVGRMNVEKLYPPGTARSVMKMIREPGRGGPGRLEEEPVEMLGATGERFPVKLSAALIMDQGTEVGSVGIFTDIREKLRMAERLKKAQEELRHREKQSIVAELAGAAAHELNQPLTSVMGYATMLERFVAEDVKLSHAVRVILGETERMAEIVRKIGTITRYETKSYVGSQKILDLERATTEDPLQSDTPPSREGG